MNMALWRLMKIAKQDDKQARLVASFLLAWWNPDTYGGFNLTDLWLVDEEIADDMVAVTALVHMLGEYPDDVVLESEFEEVVAQWRPHRLHS